MPRKIREEKKQVEDLLKKFNSSKEFRRPLESRWLDYYKAYRSYLERKEEGVNRSNLHIPYTFQTVETIVPRMVASRPKLVVLPREENDTESAKTMQALVDFQWQEMDMEEKLEDLVRAGLIYGTSPLKLGWDAEGDNPTVNIIDILDFYPDPEATSPDNMEFAFHRVMRSPQEIEERYGVKIPKGHEGDSEKTHDGRHNVAGIDNQKGAPKSRKVEVLEYWDKDKVCVIAARKLMLRKDTNPFGRLPFVVFRDYVVPNELYGIGEVEHIHTLQQEANSLRNQMMDNNNLIINKMWKVRRSGGVNPRNLVARPGGIINVNDMTDIEPMVHAPLPTYAFNLQEVIKGDIQQTTGVTDYQTGGSPDNKLNDTATGIALIQEAGNARFKLKLRHLESAIRDIGTFFVQLNQNLLTSDKVIRVTGNTGVEFQNVGFQEISGNFDLVPEAGSTQPVDPNADIQKFMSYLAALGQIGALEAIPKKTLVQLISDKFEVKEAETIIDAMDEQEEVQQAPEQGQPQGQPLVRNEQEAQLLQQLIGG